MSESKLLEKISKLKEQMCKSPNPTEEITASFQVPTVDLPSFTSENPNFKRLLDEKQARIYALEEELASAKDSYVRKEQELTEKYESLLKTANAKTESLIAYYEGIISKLKFEESPLEVDHLKATLSQRESEYNQFYTEYQQLQHELYNIQEEMKLTKNYSKATEFEVDYEKAVEIAELWKKRSDQLGLRFFTFLRALRIDLYELKNFVMSYFEESLTEASSIVAICAKKYRKSMKTSENFVKEVVKENRRLRAGLSKVKYSVS